MENTTVSKDRAKIFTSVYGVAKISEIKERFEVDYINVKNKGTKEIYKLYRDYSLAIFYKYSLSSIRNNLVDFKNIIKKNGGKYESIALEAFSLPDIYTPLNHDNTIVKRQLKQDIKDGTNKVIDATKIENEITTLQNILDEKKYFIANNQNEKQVRAYYIAIMLGLATGRRFTELLKTLVVEKHGTKISFSGLLKGNDMKIEGKIIKLTYHQVKEYLTELRAFTQTENLTIKEVNTKYSRVFNNQAKKIRGNKNLNMKSTRHDYSIAGSQIFKKKGESVEDTITRILGHRETFTGALNYTS